MSEPSSLGVVEIKVFVPARDFAWSIALYEALGFAKASEDEGMAYLDHGSARFYAAGATVGSGASRDAFDYGRQEHHA